MDLFLIIVLILGLLFYFLPFTNGKFTEIGRLMFACALIAICMRGGLHLRLS